MKTLLVLLILAGSSSVAHAQLPPAATGKVDYERDVRPLLAQNCYSCHGPEVQQSGLRLDLRQNALRGGDYGPVIVPGNSAESKLIRRLINGDGGLQMPPSGSLTDDEIGLLRAWIDQGPEFRTEIVESSPKPIDPKLQNAISAVRWGTRAAVMQVLAEHPDILTAKDSGGSTLLHHAAGFGRRDVLELLLEKGADVNAKNRRSATPLHWAVHDLAKTKILLSHGAAINARQVEGRTALYQAALLGGGFQVLQLLLANGADPNIASMVGQPPLSVASIRGDVAAMQALIDRGAKANVTNGAGETPLMAAATSGNTRAVLLLLDNGADVTIKSKRNETALGNAATAGVVETVQLLLDRGAQVNTRNFRGYSPLMLAAGSDTLSPAIVKLLLDKGADTTYAGDYDETAHMLAAKRGNTEVARLLGSRESSNQSMRPMQTTVAHSRTPPAISAEKALRLLEQQSHNFIRIAGCNSCHSQDLPSAAAGYARSRGVGAAPIPQLPPSMQPAPERIMDLGAISVNSIAWELLDFGMNRADANFYTDAVVRYIKAMQTPDGNWSTNESRRPPMNTGDFQTAALAIYALKHYGRPADLVEIDAAISRAVRWLEKAAPVTTQDRAFHLLGLAWGSGSPVIIKRAARSLAAMQRADGGWSQLPAMSSDAYATGQVLFALHQSRTMGVTHHVYRSGLEYLRSTQAADGSWHVTTRAIWLQPYFESGFPYGRDQFISAAGTAWAVMALTPAIEPTTPVGRLATRAAK